MTSAPTRKESDVYDRQIRLWGAEAQAKMAKARVLYIHVTGLTSEIIKNLVLAGIRASICDERPYPDAVQSTPSFFFTKQDRKQSRHKNDDDVGGNDKNKKTKRTVADIMGPKVEELNPLLGDCEIVNRSVAELSEEILKDYSIVIASRLSISDAIRISEHVVKHGGKFYLADCFGFSGASAFDLGANHTYRPELGKKLLQATVLRDHVPLEAMFRKILMSDATNRFHKKPLTQWVQYRCLLEYAEQKGTWPSTSSAADFVETITPFVAEQGIADHEAVTVGALQKLATVASAEIAPVCSVLGGVLGNEVIKAISGKGEPANNTLLFDGVVCKVWTFLVKPKP